MSKTVKELFANTQASIIGDANTSVSGLAYSSNAVRAGDAFFCIVGFTTDGHSYAQDAIDNGARVLVVERKVYLADASDVVEVVVPDSRKALAIAASNFYDNPSENFSLVGVTGTNGKTTTTYLIEHIAKAKHMKTGIIGTVGIQIGDEKEKTSHTTPESSDLQEIFARMARAQCQVVSMEVSSHALDLKRTWGTKFAVTVFTNLTQDHLDYHHTFEDYFEAKSLLFGNDYPAKRVVCINDAWGKKIASVCKDAGDALISVGFTNEADIFPVSATYSAKSTDVVLSIFGEEHAFTSPLVGRFNVENLMCAFGAAIHLGISVEDIIASLKTSPYVPGRLQRIDIEASAQNVPSVFVDYAHTPDALAKAIASVDAISQGRIFVVFGCGGNRDKSKRPIMGKCALQATYAIVTSDNPRNEEPAAIIADIVAGMENDAQAKDENGHARFECIEDRRSAIARAIELANPSDSILIAGKGHEDYQLVGNEVLSFDDAVVAKEELEHAYGKEQA